MRILILVALQYTLGNVYFVLCTFDETNPTMLFVKQGGEALLNCSFEGNMIWDVYNASWIILAHDGATIDSTKYITAQNPLSGLYFGLRILNVGTSDEKKYRCQAGIQKPFYLQLELLVPPSSVKIENATSTNRLLGTEGQDLTVACVAVGGKPLSSVTIKVDGTVLANGNQSVTYILKSISRSYDRKAVTCQANNEANVNNPNSYTTLLYLNLKPLQPTFSLDPVITEETKPLVVSCTSTGSRPAATFKWMIGVTTITSDITTTPVLNTTDDTYTVTSTLTYTVERTYHGQTVTCGAYNNVSTSGVVTSAAVDVKFAPYITVTNGTYDQNTAIRTVTCKPAGNPTTYTYNRWQHKSAYGVLIRELDGGQDGVLTIPSVPVESGYQDSGEYICTASNGITGRDGSKQQTGSGYVNINAQPTFTKDNDNVKYGEFGKDVDMNIYVYSVPKYTSIQWYKFNTIIGKANKYNISELQTIVYNAFHGTKVQLNGYKVTLTIKNLVESDFNVSYRVELSNGVGQPVIYTTLLESISAPETPKDFLVLSSSECSIVVQWEAGYNGGHEQTFYVEYRGFGSSTWEPVKILDTKQSGRQIYTVNRLQDGTSYVLRMYAENKFNKSLPTETITKETIKASKLSPSECAIAGVAGGLSAIILLQFIINVVLLILWRKETGKKRPKTKSARWKDETSYHNPMDCKETDEPENKLYVKGKQNKALTGSAQEYETLGMKDNPNTYSALQSQQDKHKPLAGSAQEYETLGMKDNPTTYSALLSQQDQQQMETNVSHYESVREPNKSTVYENT